MKIANKHFGLTSTRLLAGTCGLIMLLALAPMGFAQQTVAVQSGKAQVAPPAAPAVANLTASSAVKPAKETETAAPNTADNQGIRVHGHWVLQVKNADGTLGERREFDNSLVTDDANLSGNQVLAALLSGNATAGDPAVLFIQSPSGSNPSGYCQAADFGNQNRTCWGLTTNETQLAATNPTNFFTGLSATASFSTNVNWVLSGNFTIPTGLSSISVVQTLLMLCAKESAAFLGPNETLQGTTSDRNADLPSSGCTAVGGGGGTTTGTPADFIFPGFLTSTSVPGGPLAVTTGQIVQVSVTISFS